MKAHNHARVGGCAKTAAVQTGLPGELAGESAHGATSYLVLGRNVTVIGVAFEHGRFESEGGQIVAQKRIREAADRQAIYVRSLCLLREITKHVVEGAILHHQHHDMLDVRQQAGVERWLEILRERFELTRRQNVSDRE